MDDREVRQELREKFVSMWNARLGELRGRMETALGVPCADADALNHHIDELIKLVDKAATRHYGRK